jgi:hypothetical protein
VWFSAATHLDLDVFIIDIVNFAMGEEVWS